VSSQSYITTDSQSVSPSWCQAPIYDPRPIRHIFFFLDNYGFVHAVPSLMRGRVCNLQCNDASSILSYIATDGLSASSSWCRPLRSIYDQILIYLFDNYSISSWCRAPSPISPTNRVIQPEIDVKNKNHVSVGRNF
jgi:hypothetical protein